MNHNFGHSSIIISGMGGQIFWFLFEKMDKTYKAPDIPRFTKEDGRKIAEKRLKSHVTESVLFEEVWNGTSTFDMVPMEEGLFKHQHFGRMAIIGDAAHKVSHVTAFPSVRSTRLGFAHCCKGHNQPRTWGKRYDRERHYTDKRPPQSSQGAPGRPRSQNH